MKSQLPSMLTQRSVWTLFFLTLLILKQTEAGNAFRNCLTYRSNNENYYELLVNYFSENPLTNNNNDIFVCCGDPICPNCCVKCDSAQANSFGGFKCTNFLNRTYCISSYDYYLQCGGMIGNGLIDEFSDNCFNSNSSQIKGCINYWDKLPGSTERTGNTFGWGYGYQFCNINNFVYPFSCNWDNGGWFCSSDTSLLDNCTGSWRVEWPGPADKNPSIYTYAPTLTSTATSKTNNHLIEEIAIPVGAVTGTGFLSGLTCYFCKKKKRKNQMAMAAANSQRSVQSESIEQLATNNLAINENQIKNEISKLNEQEQLNKQLEIEAKLVGHQQLWTDYLEANNLAINNPHSQLLMKSFSQLENELLEFLTIEEIELLKNTPIQTSSHSTNPQTEYFEIIEEAHNPQWNEIPTEAKCRSPQWRG